MAPADGMLLPDSPLRGRRHVPPQWQLTPKLTQALTLRKARLQRHRPRFGRARRGKDEARGAVG